MFIKSFQQFSFWKAVIFVNTLITIILLAFIVHIISADLSANQGNKGCNTTNVAASSLVQFQLLYGNYCINNTD